MAESEKVTDPQLVECEVCLTEVPASGAANEETSDYVFYFCGIDCYAQWKEKARRETKVAVEK
ncbi:MAG: DUF3330 domain-containing protein [Gammaproteobacteria bacterium]|jgi:hypothetical protein